MTRDEAIELARSKCRSDMPDYAFDEALEFNETFIPHEWVINSILEASENAAIRVYKDGNRYCATYLDFIDLQVSKAGFGNTEKDAIQNLKHQ